MEKNQRISEYLNKLNGTPKTNYSLWKATKRLKQRGHPPIRNQAGSWARNEEEKAKIFVEHLSKVSKPNPRKTIQEEENRLLFADTIPVTQDIPINLFISDVKAVINHLNPKKAPGYNLITNKVLKMLLKTAIKHITQLQYCK